MTDTLTRAVNALDRRRARRSRLEPERVVLPPRAAGDAVRRFCGTCWATVNELAEQRAWHERVGCTGWAAYSIGRQWRDGCRWFGGQCVQHPYPGVTVCPKCQGELYEVALG